MHSGSTMTSLESVATATIPLVHRLSLLFLIPRWLRPTALQPILTGRCEQVCRRQTRSIDSIESSSRSCNPT
jgi:hypothetical protein